MSLKPQPSKWVLTLNKINDYLMTSVGCGPKILQTRHGINAHKVPISIAYLLIMFFYDLDFTSELGHRACLLLTVHGIYGILWLYKDRHFPDANWSKPATVGSVLLLFFGLFFYYTPMLFLVSGYVPQLRIFDHVAFIYVGLVFYIFGIFFHYTSDCQKYFQLKYQNPRDLISEGMFYYTRSPNYLGEILIYLGFVFLSAHLVPFLCFVPLWLQLFVPNIITKDVSISRYPNYETYKSNTWILLPKFYRDWF